MWKAAAAVLLGVLSWSILGSLEVFSHLLAPAPLPMNMVAVLLLPALSLNIFSPLELSQQLLDFAPLHMNGL